MCVASGDEKDLLLDGGRGELGRIAGGELITGEGNGVTSWSRGRIYTLHVRSATNRSKLAQIRPSSAHGPHPARHTGIPCDLTVSDAAHDIFPIDHPVLPPKTRISTHSQSITLESAHPEMIWSR